MEWNGMDGMQGIEWNARNVVWSRMEVGMEYI